jgi:hypothetical protein
VTLPGKHGPNRLGNYLDVHASYIADLTAEGFVVEDQSRFTFLAGVVVLEGVIVCRDGITLDVRKEIEVLRGRGMAARVQTRRFRYHAWIRGRHNILRYESAHEHREHAHKHVYDTLGTGRETGTVDLVTEDAIPTLGEVLRELQAWHEAHAARLRYLT